MAPGAATAAQTSAGLQNLPKVSKLSGCKLCKLLLISVLPQPQSARPTQGSHTEHPGSTSAPAGQQPVPTDTPSLVQSCLRPNGTGRANAVSLCSATVKLRAAAARSSGCLTSTSPFTASSQGNWVSRGKGEEERELALVPGPGGFGAACSRRVNGKGSLW